MLAVVSGGQNIEAVRILYANKASVSNLDSYGNNILHLAVMYGNTDALDYLLSNAKNLSIYERNEAGETPMSIAAELKNEKAMKILERYVSQNDQSKLTTDALLNELDTEAELKE